MGLDPGVFGRFDLAALVQPHLKFLFVCLSSCIGILHAAKVRMTAPLSIALATRLGKKLHVHMNLPRCSSAMFLQQSVNLSYLRL